MKKEMIEKKDHSGPMRLMGLMGLMRLMGPMRLMRLMGLIGLMGLMGGCSSEQEPPVEPKPEVKETAIAFSGNMTEEEVTRATTPLEDKGITSFSVWGFKNMDNGYTTYQTVMPGYHVRYEASNSSVTNTDGWDYILPAYPDQTPKYWDMKAKAYRFFAATSGTTVTGKKENESDESFSSYQVSFTADAINEEMTPYYSKLWFSNNSNGEFGKPVTLQFMQLLSKVRFMIILADPTIPLLLEEDDFRPTNKELRIAKKANVTITYPLKGNETTEQVDIDPSSNQSLSALNRRWTEGTALFKLGDTYYIAYSANFFGGDWYAVGYATAKKPLGPYTKAANNPILEKNTQNGGTVRGVGHGNIFFSPDRSEAYYVYHARTDTNDRKLFIDKMIINGDGTIAIDGPSVDPRPVPSFVKPK